MVLVERDNRIGGLAKSYNYDGQIFDTGPKRFHTDDAMVLDFIQEITKGHIAKIGRSTKVYFLGNYFEWPLQTKDLLKMPLDVSFKCFMDLLKERLKIGPIPIAGYAITIPSPVVTQAFAAAGADFVWIDQEHGPIGPEAVHAMIAATSGTTCSPWVRVGRRDEALVKTALDAGAEGIVFPLVRTADEAAECVALTRYPPKGRRGWGPFVAHSRWGTPLFQHLEQRGDATVCGLMIETTDAIANIREIAAVDGIDFLFIAPFDLSTELGVSGKFDAPELKDAIRRAEDAILEAGIAMGGAAMSREQTVTARERGYRVIVHGFDVLVLKAHCVAASEWRC